MIYFRNVPKERLYLGYAYVKSAQVDLPREQLKAVAELTGVRRIRAESRDLS